MADMSPPKGAESKVGAGAAGVGGGTLLVVIANNLREGNPFKPWLVLAAPSVSIFVGALWLWFRVKVANHLRDREAQLLIDSAKRTLEEALNNPNTSDEHRLTIRKELEKLELLAVGRYLERIKSLKIITESNIDRQRSKKARVPE